jgi:hypothetical protein
MSDEKTVDDVSTTSAVDLARAIGGDDEGRGQLSDALRDSPADAFSLNPGAAGSAKPDEERPAKVENRRQFLTHPVGNMDDTVAIVGLRLKPETDKT